MVSRKVASAAISVALLGSVVASVLAVSAPTAFTAALSQVLLSSIVIMVLWLFAGVVLATLRLKLISADLGYRLSMRDAAVVLSVGQLAGNLFFQLAGQLIGRAAMLARVGVPPSASIIISGYERIFALVISMALAAVGSIYLFGQLTFDLNNGGLTLVKLGLGLTIATAAGAAVAWGRSAAAALRQLTLRSFLRALRSVAISLGIQLTTLAAYLAAGRALAPHIDFFSLAAAASVIMFAASLPISFGGWGMREMSAIFALQAVGLSSASALLVALLIGVLSIAVVAATSGLLLLPTRPAPRPSTSAAQPATDYTLVLDWLLPTAAATAVFFQLYLPTGRGDLNVNLADPLVLIGAALFVLRHIGKRWPAWRVPALNWYLAAGSLAIIAAFLHGFAAFGWTDWAFTNRLLGWGMLMCYVATGALIAVRANEDGLRFLLATFAATGAALAAFDLGIVTLIQLGASSLYGMAGSRIAGFSQNPNAFAFMLLLALSAALVLQDRLRARGILMVAVLSGIWYCGSRAALLSAPIVVALAFLGGIRPRPVITALGWAVLVLLAIAVVPYLFALADLVAWPNSATNSLGGAGTIVAMLQEEPSAAQHWLTIQQGLAMFAAHPLFGAGLGAYMAEQIHSTGIPLVIHSTPVWLLAETGLAGAMLFAVLAWRVFALEFRRRHQLAALTIILVLGLFAVMSQVHELLYQRALWMLLGAALAVPVTTNPEAVRWPSSGSARSGKQRPAA